MSENNAAATPAPENRAPPLAGTKGPAEKSKPKIFAVVIVPELAEPLPQQPKTADPVARNTTKPPALASENDAAAPPAPENDAPTLGGTKGPAQKSKPAIAVLSEPERAEPLPQQLKTVDAVSRSTPKPPLASETNAAAPPVPENGPPTLAGTKAPAQNGNRDCGARRPEG